MVTGLSAWYSHVTADTSILSPALVDTFLLDTGFKDVGRFIIGGTFGYAHTFAFWKKGFIHTALVPRRHLHPSDDRDPEWHLKRRRRGVHPRIQAGRRVQW